MSWFPNGLSAQAIAGSGKHHPWDPADLRRCMNYCESVGISTDALRVRMAGRSMQWDRLLPEWDLLTQLLRDEMSRATDGKAPQTYAEMKRVLADGVTCEKCDGTGRGAECPKCRGSGSRSGGRCRASGCVWGAWICDGCQGRGYNPKASAHPASATTDLTTSRTVRVRLATARRTTMNNSDRWRVAKGTGIGWRVLHGIEITAVFATWTHAYEWARQQAIYEGLGIISLEITS